MQKKQLIKAVNQYANHENFKTSRENLSTLVQIKSDHDGSVSPPSPTRSSPYIRKTNGLNKKALAKAHTVLSPEPRERGNCLADFNLASRKLSIIEENLYEGQLDEFDEAPKSKKRRTPIKPIRSALSGAVGDRTIVKKSSQSKQVDDVYDENVAIKGHVLYTLRDKNVLDYQQFIL